MSLILLFLKKIIKSIKLKIQKISIRANEKIINVLYGHEILYIANLKW